MNFIKTPTIAGRSLGLFVSLVVAAAAYAGPGPQYWQSLGQPPEASTKIGCPAPHEAHVTVMERTLPNGRGPLQAVDIGTAQACSSCCARSTVLERSLANHRGPLQAVEVASPQYYYSSFKPTKN